MLEGIFRCPRVESQNNERYAIGIGTRQNKCSHGDFFLGGLGCWYRVVLLRTFSIGGKVGELQRKKQQISAALHSQNCRWRTRENLTMKTWFVSYRHPSRPAGSSHARAAETFETEAEAKSFARQLSANDINAGTLNPYTPKQFYGSRDIAIWLADDANSTSLRPQRTAATSPRRVANSSREAPVARFPTVH